MEKIIGEKSTANSFDFIVIGAGSAGCILGHRLSESGKFRVLVLEAGAKDKGLWFNMPVGYAKLYYHKYHNYGYQTEPEANLLQRQLYLPMGKVQGGSGSINAMIYVRGHKDDFDSWAEATDERWSYKNVLPYFKNMEAHPLGNTDYHSADGYLGITQMRGKTHPLCDHYLKGCHELGLPLSDDFNGEHFEGGGIYEANIRDGKRDSSSKAYLNKAAKLDHVVIAHHAVAQKILFDRDKRAIGVLVEQKGKKIAYYAAKEVILSAGPIESPKLLQLSGVGDQALLKRHGIDVVADLPAVGKNLQDHICVSFYYESVIKTLNDELGSLWGQANAGLKYLWGKKGPLALSVNQAGGFFRSHEGLTSPDMQLYFNPLSYTIGRGKTRVRPEPYSGFLVAFNSCRPTSRGSVEISAADASKAPLIRPRYLSTPEDQASAIRGCHFVRKLLQAPALKKVTLKEVTPGAWVDDDAAFLQYFREHAGSIYHQCGTNAMGRDQKNTVVASDLKVHGVHGLRVADASVFPKITSGNTNAPVMMVAEKAASMVLHSWQ